MAKTLTPHQFVPDGIVDRVALKPIGPFVHVASRRRDTVEFWALASGGPPIARHFRAFGAGQDVPNAAVYRGTALTPTGTGRFALDFGLFVWHLFETNDPER